MVMERLWRLLPDRCQCVGCERQGMRGNENWVGGKFVCDDCYAKSGHLFLATSWIDRHPRLKPWIFAATLLYIAGGAICFTIAVMRMQ